VNKKNYAFSFLSNLNEFFCLINFDFLEIFFRIRETIRNKKYKKFASAHKVEVKAQKKVFSGKAIK
jgi:hypothetical protein